MTDNIKRCPFCGGVPEIKQVTNHETGNLIVVRCTMCNASTRTFSEYKPEYAIEAWNCRKDEQE